MAGPPGGGTTELGVRGGGYGPVASTEGGHFLHLGRTAETWPKHLRIVAPLRRYARRLLKSLSPLLMDSNG